MNGRNPIDIVFLLRRKVLPKSGKPRGPAHPDQLTESIPAPGNRGERTEGIAKQLQDLGSRSYVPGSPTSQKEESTACGRPGVSGSGPRASFRSVRAGGGSSLG